MGRVGPICLVAGVIWLLGSPWVAAEEAPEEVQQLEELVVEEKAGAPGIEQSPSRTVIDIEEFETIGPQTSIIDVLKTQAIVDFRGQTDLDPGVDSIFLRGFGANRFVTAIDALTVQKTGGRKSSNIVDYALLPTFLIKEIEILPGPHSPLYDSKSIGGVVNLVTRRPERKESLKPDVALTASYGSYETQNHIASLQGAVKNLTYDAAYRYYSTDGYLRNNQTDIKTAYGRIGYLLPADGFVTFSGSRTDTDREAPVNNPGSDGDFDDDYPRTEGGPFEPFQKPTWDGQTTAYRLNIDQPSPIGRLHLGAYWSKDQRNRSYFVNPGDTDRSELDTTWWQQGDKIQDEIQWTENHTTTLGFDLVRLYDVGLDDSKKERINKKGGYLQHRWGILPSLDLTLGLRYEHVKVWVSNESRGNPWIPGRDRYIIRKWDHLIPKSFVTWRMDPLASWLRDTSLSLGVSKIWRAPDYHGDYNPQGRPAGAWLEAEHGIGYDLVLDRRLWRDIGFKFTYSFYDIKDYIATNSQYAKFSGPGAGSQRFSDYKVNLKEVYRYGIDVELGGHLLDNLSFYLAYAWQHFDNRGDELAGKTELDQRAKHRLSVGLRYDLFERTTLLLDYYYQSDEASEISEEIAPDVYDFRRVEIDAYHTVAIGIQQRLFEQLGFVKDAVLNLYVRNLFDEKYYDASGFPATDRFVGASLRFCL